MKKLIVLFFILLSQYSQAQEYEYHSRLSLTTSVADSVFGLPVTVEVKEDSKGDVVLLIVSKDSSLRVSLSIKRTNLTAGDFLAKSPLSTLPCWDVDGVVILNGKKLRETEIIRLELGFGLFSEGECPYDFSLETIRPENVEGGSPRHVPTLRGGTLMYVGDILLCGNPYVAQKIEEILYKRGY